MVNHSEQNTDETNSADSVTEPLHEERLFVLFDYDSRELSTTQVYPSYTEAAEDAALLNNVIVVPLLLRHTDAASNGPQGS